jgi:hypothetical protein
MEHGGRTPQQGPIFDRAMRQVAEGDLTAFCSWLGVHTDGPVELRSGSFPAGTMHADLLAQVTPGRLLHVEYQRITEPDLAVRMLGYRAQIMRRYPGLGVTQHVIVLGDGWLQPCDDLETGFRLGLRITYLRELDPEPLLATAGLAPLAVLASGDQGRRAQSLAGAFEMIRSGTTPGSGQDQLLEAAAILATIRLDRLTIDQIAKESGMTVESIADFYSDTKIGQELLRRGEAKGEARGEARGEAKGEARGVRATLEALLKERFGDQDDLPAVAAGLAHWASPAAAVQAITTAGTLDDLRREPPPVGPVPRQ